MSKTIVLWEFAKKQNYIFKSNKLIENIGASLIIKDVSEIDKKYNLIDDNFITRGGGKSIYIFNNLESATTFIKKYSKDILTNYPGVEMVFVKTSFDEEKDDFQETIEQLYQKLELKKNKKEFGGALAGFGIEKKCQSTSLAASYYDNDECISSEIKIKREYSQKQNKDFNDLIPEGYSLEKEIGKLINKETKNYIAIVHIDGNSMGKKLKNILNSIKKEKYSSMKEYNAKCILKMKLISEKINEVYTNAFKYMLQIVAKNKDNIKDYCNIEKKLLPVRPLILAGDDVTFIAPGVMGLECARIMIKKISDTEIIIDGEKLDKLTACAGISIIKSGYPFIRAYNMAEDLCQNAKRLVLDSGINANALDYHIALGDINGSIKEIREKYYTSEDSNNPGNLSMKPLFLDNVSNIQDNIKWHTYDNLCSAIDNVNNAINDEKIARGKIKQLRSVLKEGEAATERYFKFYNLGAGNYLKPLDGTFGDYCFNTKDNKKECMYLDAIETYEYFIKLDE